MSWLSSFVELTVNGWQLAGGSKNRRPLSVESWRSEIGCQLTVDGRTLNQQAETQKRHST